MAKQFLHLGINFKTAGSTSERLNEIEAVLNNATDWLRYTPDCWLLYTGRSPATWNKILRDEIPWITEQAYLICQVDTRQKAGWLQRSIWDWINKDRSS
jgi:hypothetical protein